MTDKHLFTCIDCGEPLEVRWVRVAIPRRRSYDWGAWELDTGWCPCGYDEGEIRRVEDRDGIQAWEILR